MRGVGLLAALSAAGTSAAMTPTFVLQPGSSVKGAMGETWRSGSRSICVLGVHRGGTSVATRVLALLGCDLGPEDQLMPATQYNEAGYWENLAVVDLNDALL